MCLTHSKNYIYTKQSHVRERKRTDRVVEHFNGSHNIYTYTYDAPKCVKRKNHL